MRIKRDDNGREVVRDGMFTLELTLPKGTLGRCNRVIGWSQIYSDWTEIALDGGRDLFIKVRTEGTDGLLEVMRDFSPLYVEGCEPAEIDVPSGFYYQMEDLDGFSRERRTVEYGLLLRLRRLENVMGLERARMDAINDVIDRALRGG